MTRQEIKISLLLPIALVVSACSAKAVPFNVASNPPGAKIYVNNVFVGKAPTKITLKMKKRWVGSGNFVGYKYGDETYKISARPPQNESKKLAAQTKIIEPNLTPGGGVIKFDLTSKQLQPNRVL